MRHNSPLRYPGGKASLADFLAQTIELNDLTGCSYFEPFAGGAGAALRLLAEDAVSELHLNDLDPRITSFWNAALNESERFTDAVMSVPLTVAEWRRQRQVCRRADMSNRFDLGFATFYLNRCNRSGILLGAAPIGGYSQLGRWTIDARFNRKALADRILNISRQRERIHITNMDARAFLTECLPGGRDRKRVFAYLDPPYYSNGRRLYMNYYEDEDHRRLACYMQGQGTLKWLMSYDDSQFVKELYTRCVVSHIPIRYTLQRKREAREFLIAPTHLQLPDPVDPANARDRTSSNAQEEGMGEFDEQR